jgi:hypothetical protein
MINGKLILVNDQYTVFSLSRPNFAMTNQCTPHGDDLSIIRGFRKFLGIASGCLSHPSAVS